MQTASSHDRVKGLYLMLFEMATGNFTFRLHSSEADDRLDELARLLNQVAQAMRETILNANHIIPHYHYQSLVQTTFILQSDFKIDSLSASVTQVFGHQPQMLFKIPFSNLLAIQSITLWQQIETEVQADANYHNTQQLIFVTPAGTVLPTFCTISRLLYSDKIFISSVSRVLQHALADTWIPKAQNQKRTSSANLFRR